MKRDFLINIIASVVLTAATQLMALPFLGQALSQEEYGLMLTLVGVANTVGVSLGNSLNNSRLLLQPEYDGKGFVGDFNRIAIRQAVICFLVAFSAVAYVCHWMLAKAFGMALVALLVFSRSYYSVAFRIVINYKKILLMHCCGFAGYVFGIVFCIVTHEWVLVFVSGELSMILYLLRNGDLHKEAIVKTPLYSKSVEKYRLLLGASVLGTAMTYMDRFVLYPLLGPGEVSTYVVASLLGKTIGIVALPIANVLLTYYAKETNALSLSVFFKRVATSLGLCAMGYVVVQLLSPPVLGVLYPTLVESALPYCALANLAAVLLIAGNIIQPSLMKSAKDIWQPVIQFAYLAIYLLLVVYCSLNFGLIGFCVACVLANTFRIALMIVVMTMTIVLRSRKAKSGN